MVTALVITMNGHINSIKLLYVESA